VGVTYHNAALYEFLWLIPIILVLLYLDKKNVPAGVMAGSFAIMYGIARFLTDFVRINDERLYGLTGAQYMTALLTLFGIWVVWSSLRRHREETAAAAAVGTPSPSTTSEN
jgi:phosphatidylglycerol:prolipoprotein diacylglycerol transferase